MSSYIVDGESEQTKEALVDVLSFSDDMVSLNRSERMAYLATLALLILLFSLDYVFTFKKKKEHLCFLGYQVSSHKRSDILETPQQ